MIKKILVVLGGVDMRQLLLSGSCFVWILDKVMIFDFKNVTSIFYLLHSACTF